jgi:Transposase DDE domain
MNEDYIVAVYYVIDEMLKQVAYEDDVRSQVSAAEILTVAVIAAQYFHNHWERTLAILIQQRVIRCISISRFNRRLHALQDWLNGIVVGLGELFTGGEVYIIDSMPMPVCKRVRARRCRKVRGIEYCGYCAAKKEPFFGWRLQLICTANGIPVSFDLLPAAHQDLTPIHELTYALPNGARLFADKGYISAPDAKTILQAAGVRLIAAPRKNMAPLSWADEYDLKLYRKQIETVYSRMEKMGSQRLYSRTNPGFKLKAFASVLALAFTNILN